MSLAKKLIETSRREDAGGRSSNRFDYQKHWALAKLLEMFDESKDFTLITEFYDDIIVLDSSSDPKFIDFYQIKTNTKKRTHYISPAVLVGKDESDDMSFMEKLIDNFARFRSETRSLHFVSNKFYNTKLSNSEDSREKYSICLNELEDSDLDKIKSNMCNVCAYDGCNEECKRLIYLDVSDLDVNNYTNDVIGRMMNFLLRHGQGQISDGMAVYNTLLSELSRITNDERKITDFSDLIKRKSITRDKFQEYIREFKKSSAMLTEWGEISSGLGRENFASMEILRIGKQWRKYRIDVLEMKDYTLEKIKEDVRFGISNEMNVSTYREIIDNVHGRISDKSYYKSGLYNKDYFTAVILAI